MATYYKIVKFYRRGHEQVFRSRAAAEAALVNAAENSTAEHYSELWEYKDDDIAEQVALYENSRVELCVRDPLKAIREQRARLSKR